VALPQAPPQKLLVQPSVEELHIWSHWLQIICEAAKEERTSMMQTTVMVVVAAFGEEAAPVDAILQYNRWFCGVKAKLYILRASSQGVRDQMMLRRSYI
jgi:hypothetical protein